MKLNDNVDWRGQVRSANFKLFSSILEHQTQISREKKSKILKTAQLVSGKPWFYIYIDLYKSVKIGVCM